MQAVIMAGGKGTRLTAITKDEIPKPMVPLKGKPLLLWQVEQLKKNGITDLIFITGHLGERIEAYFQDGREFGVSIRYIREREPLGTAGAFFYLNEQLSDEYFLLVFGDVFFEIDIQRMEAFHREKKAAATLFVHPNSHPFDSDLVTLDADGRVKRLDSKHQVREGWYDNCVNAGFYLLNREICDRVMCPAKMDLEKEILMPMVAKAEAVYGYCSPEYIKDIGTVERISQAAADLERGLTVSKCLRQKQSAFFLDRDGTINQHRGLIYREEDFVLEEGAIEAIRLINASGRLAIVVTNQPSVARGLCGIEQIERIHRKMATLLGREGVFLDEVLYCPHHPDKGYPEENPAYKISCMCRKPHTGMIDQCVERYHIDLANSWMIGDTTTDLQTGKNAGMKTALVLTGEAGKDGKYPVEPDLCVGNLYDTVKRILD